MKSNDLCRDCGYTDFLGVECAWPSNASLGPSRAELAKRPQRGRRFAAIAALMLALGGFWQIGQAGYIHAKAWLAQALIADAWSRTRDGERQARPWPWADTWPVARLRVPARKVDAYVLAGANGRTIAFGPGHVFGTAAPGEPGNSVIGAHRVTHFAFLHWVRNGDLIELDTHQGRTVRYRINHMEVVDKSDTRPLTQSSPRRELTLVTCYPFDALKAGGPLRYVVSAEEV